MNTPTMIFPPNPHINCQSPNRRSLYEDLCLRLNLDEQTRQEAWKLLERFYQLQVQGENEQLWPVCAIYVIATKSLGTETQSGVPLSQMLRDSSTRLYDFFVPLKTFVTTLQINPKIVERLQMKYIVVTLLFEKYLQLYSKLFKIDLENLKRHSGTTPRKIDPTEKILKFGWYLFLLAKGKLLSNPGDFVQCLHLLLSCVNLLVVHMPESLRKIMLKEILLQNIPSSTQTSTQLPDTLLYLCCTNHANYDQVKDMQDRIFNAWVNTLCTNSILHYQPAKIPPDPALYNRFYLGGLLDSSLDENEKTLNSEYEVLLYDTCDFDERLFLERHLQIQSPMRPPPSVSSNNTNTPSGSGSINSGYRGSGSMTPAKAALNANDWLIKTLSCVEDGPSHVLKQFLSSSRREDLLHTVQNRVANLMEQVDFQTDNIDRKELVTKLYYRLLDAIITSETKRLNSGDCGALLSQDLFNKSLLAGCLEIVICTYQPGNMRFPWILQKLDISPFDFYTIVECIVKHEPRLPHMVTKHLIRIEERILEELAWEHGSPVYAGLNEEQRRVLRDRLEKSVGTPKKINHNACKSFVSPTKVTSLVHKKVELFLRKVAYLAHLRICELARELTNEGVNQSHLIQQFEYVLMHILTQTTLIQDRHMDQLIMCIVYGMCKINRIPITFKLIIEKYLVQPQAHSQTFRLVRLTSTKFGDIIKFYNSIFLTEMESFLLEFEPTEGDEKPSTSTTSPSGTNANKSPNRGTRVVPSGGTSGSSSMAAHLRVYSPLSLHKSPQKIHNLLVSPRRTPLLFREGGQRMSNSIILGSLKSPQSDFEKINNSINKTTTTNNNKAKRKLDYDGIIPNFSENSENSGTTPTPTSTTPTTTSGDGVVKTGIPVISFGMEGGRGVNPLSGQGGEGDRLDVPVTAHVAAMEEDEDMEDEEDDDDEEEEDEEEEEEDEEGTKMEHTNSRKRKSNDTVIVASIVDPKKPKRTR